MVSLKAGSIAFHDSGSVSVASGAIAAIIDDGLDTSSLSPEPRDRLPSPRPLHLVRPGAAGRVKGGRLRPRAQRAGP